MAKNIFCQRFQIIIAITCLIFNVHFVKSVHETNIKKFEISQGSSVSEE